MALISGPNYGLTSNSVSRRYSMANPSETSPAVHSCALPPQLAGWRSLVQRSIATWEKVSTNRLAGDTLAEFHSLDYFFKSFHQGGYMMFWFFQQRDAFMSQRCMEKWSRDRLDDYVLLPAMPGFVTRNNSFFVSHFWRTRDDPDPGGEYLRLHQSQLKGQEWQYIWVDWTCMPQSPRSRREQAYFNTCLRTMSGIIRNCGFIYFYPPFEARLWILYEITEYVLTCDGGVASIKTPDVEPFLDHVDEMLKVGVQTTLEKHGYRCSYDGDRQYLMSWLELIVLLKQLHFDTDFIRKIMDHLTWIKTGVQLYSGVPVVHLQRFEGILVVDGKVHTFTPFPPLGQ